MPHILILVGQRIAFAVLILSLVVAIVYAGTEILPGDAITAMIPQDELVFFSEADLTALRAEYGMDRPAIVRFAEMWWNQFTFNFGTTLAQREPVIDRIFYPIRNSAIMSGVALSVMLILVLGMGILASLKPGGKLDTALSTGTLVSYSLPDFVVGNLFVMVFAVWLGIAPAVIMINTNADALAVLVSSFLPVAALCVAGAAYQFRLLRGGMIEVMSTDFVERARLAGLPTWRIALIHVLPAAVIPMLNGMTQFVAGLISGTVVIEAVFKFPGAGVELLRALSQRELPTIQAIAFLAALAVVAANLISDLAVIALDPRVRRRAA
ncbi:MAG: ABC transporter permease [Hyphomicrobiales bacterium]|nr:MAG: ABC transporter permease [Hyphomicrobiales bacterium]